MRSLAAALVIAGLVLAAGCRTSRQAPDELPISDQFQREQLRVFSDIRLPRRHRLIDELTARRRDIADRLLLPLSDEPINVYVFNDEERFHAYMRKHHPMFPRRRAFFVKNDTDLNVFAHWGTQVGEDLRHEVTHGYLHSVIPDLPLWLDEGLAEYFELPRGSSGFHRPHIAWLVDQSEKGEWQPDLKRLESLVDAAGMTQTEYAESWLWVHWLLETTPERKRLVQDQLARLRMAGTAQPLSTYLVSVDPAFDKAISAHLTELAERLRSEEDRAAPGP
jgi:hypothetical protein